MVLPSRAVERKLVAMSLLIEPIDNGIRTKHDPCGLATPIQPRADVSQRCF
jgi:hypothetical protein